jgi:small subunit ribosomal protein S16
MVKIRLRRIGAKNQPSYRVVVADSRAPRDGRFIETIGFYNPRTEPPTIEIKEDRALHWLSHGAQPTEAVARFLERLGTMDRLARLHKGEPLEDLLEEAATARQQLAEKEASSEIQEIAEIAEAEVDEADTTEAEAEVDEAEAEEEEEAEADAAEAEAAEAEAEVTEAEASEKTAEEEA